MKYSFLTLVVTGLLVTSLQISANSDLGFTQGTTGKLDYKNFSASFCQLGRGKLGSLGYKGTAVRNIGNDTIIVECPIVRDNHDNKDGFYFQTAHNIAIGSVMKCWVHSHNRHSGEIDVTGFLVVGAGLNLETGVSVKTSVFDGVYGLTCSLPKNSQISSYELIENGPTDNGY